MDFFNKKCYDLFSRNEAALVDVCGLNFSEYRPVSCVLPSGPSWPSIRACWNRTSTLLQFILVVKRDLISAMKQTEQLKSADSERKIFLFVSSSQIKKQNVLIWVRVYSDRLQNPLAPARLFKRCQLSVCQEKICSTTAAK